MGTIDPALGQQQCIGWVERKSLRNHTIKEEIQGIILSEKTDIQVKPNTSSGP